MRRFIAHLLFVLAAWTLVIKYAFPIAMALAESAPLLSQVWWDFWWVVHIWLGLALLNWPPYTWWIALGVSVVEIIIVVSKFILFLGAPEWDIWHTNWFINKLFVLSAFIMLFAYLLANAGWRVQPPAPLSRQLLPAQPVRDT